MGDMPHIGTVRGIKKQKTKKKNTHKNPALEHALQCPGYPEKTLLSVLAY